MKKKLWEYVKWMMEVVDIDDDGELLTEPDVSRDDDEDANEQSVCANIAGVTTPLGTTSTYPDRKKKRKIPNSK